MKIKTKYLKKNGFLLLVTALSISLTSLAWSDVSQHKSNKFRTVDTANTITLIEDFQNVSKWNVGETARKRVSVRNGSALDDDRFTYDHAFARIQFREFMQLENRNHEYSAKRYMINENGDFIRFTTQFAAQVFVNNPDNKIPNSARIEAVKGHFDDANAPQSGYFYISTQRDDINGQFGKFIVIGSSQAEEKNIEGAGSPAKGNPGQNHQNGASASESQWSIHKWDATATNNAYAKTSPFTDYVTWKLGADVITYEAWDKKPVAKWIIDTKSDQGWVYWGQHLKHDKNPSAESLTKNLLESVTLIKQPEAMAEYFLNVKLDAVNQKDLAKWTDAPKDLVQVLNDSERLIKEKEDDLEAARLLKESIARLTALHQEGSNYIKQVANIQSPFVKQFQTTLNETLTLIEAPTTTLAVSEAQFTILEQAFDDFKIEMANLLTDRLNRLVKLHNEGSDYIKRFEPYKTSEIQRFQQSLNQAFMITQSPTTTIALADRHYDILLKAFNEFKGETARLLSEILAKLTALHEEGSAYIKPYKNDFLTIDTNLVARLQTKLDEVADLIKAPTTTFTAAKTEFETLSNQINGFKKYTVELLIDSTNKLRELSSEGDQYLNTLSEIKSKGIVSFRGHVESAKRISNTKGETLYNVQFAHTTLTEALKAIKEDADTNLRLVLQSKMNKIENTDLSKKFRPEAKELYKFYKSYKNFSKEPNTPQQAIQTAIHKVNYQMARTIDNTVVVANKVWRVWFITHNNEVMLTGVVLSQREYDLIGLRKGVHYYSKNKLGIKYQTAAQKKYRRYVDKEFYQYSRTNLAVIMNHYSNYIQKNFPAFSNAIVPSRFEDEVGQQKNIDYRDRNDQPSRPIKSNPNYRKGNQYRFFVSGISDYTYYGIRENFVGPGYKWTRTPYVNDVHTPPPPPKPMYLSPPNIGNDRHDYDKPNSPGYSAHLFPGAMTSGTLMNNNGVILPVSFDGEQNWSTPEDYERMAGLEPTVWVDFTKFDLGSMR